MTILVDYYAGILIAQAEGNKRRNLLIISLITNIGFLAYFKYFNFFHENLTSLLHLFDLTNPIPRFESELPIGLSFHTFQAMSYTIEVYRRNEKPERNFSIYALYVLFYPQLVAGPIERPQNLLWQFRTQFAYDFENIKQGLIRIAWGLFKKVVIADNCAQIVNMVFENHEDYNGSSLVIAAVLFSFQIYGDFSGYSDIAIGTSRLFGFDLMQNFAYPYFSRDIAEFWRRWHISLSTWFRDYLYIPLGGSRVSKLKQIRNVLIIFIVSGFWHGANWTFIVWGAINAFFILPSIVLNTNRNNIEIVAHHSILPSFKEMLQIGFTFFITTIAWIFFRAENMTHALSYIKGISTSLLRTPQINSNAISVKILFLLLVFLLLVEWMGRKNSFALENFKQTKPIYRRIFYIVLLLLIVIFGVTAKTEFIYFAF